MDWLYRFTTNAQYPDPLEEIDELCTLDDNGELTYLLLSDREAPPMCAAATGEVVGLCTSRDGRILLHGTAIVVGDCHRGNTPPSVLPIYGNLTGRVLCPLSDLIRLPSGLLDASVLSLADQAKFLRGQSYVKNLNSGRRASKRSGHSSVRVVSTTTTFTFPRVMILNPISEFVVLGLDPTAGTWASKMTEGPKPMPSFALRWNGSIFIPDDRPLVWHKKNASFWTEAIRRQTALNCIDGPCGTNGPRLLTDVSGWDMKAPDGIRGGELALSRTGVNLFWTTQNTVTKFEGASRWIARSLVLFSEQRERTNIETHPHGAFTFLWQLFGMAGTLPKKLKATGRNARLAILRAFIPDLSDEMVPDHDAVDAACAALVAGLHRLGLTVAFGNANNGGQIWMPDRIKLNSFISV